MDKTLTIKISSTVEPRTLEELKSTLEKLQLEATISNDSESVIRKKNEVEKAIKNMEKENE